MVMVDRAMRYDLPGRVVYSCATPTAAVVAVHATEGEEEEALDTNMWGRINYWRRSR